MKIKNIFFIKTDLFIAQLIIFSQFTFGQTPAIVSFDSSHWNIPAKEKEMEDFQGQHCLKITDGAAWLKDNFENGIIEFDINFGKERVSQA